MAAVNEDDMTGELSTGESGERGRLFVKVMGVKDLDLPLPRSKFSEAIYLSVELTTATTAAKRGCILD